MNSTSEYPTLVKGFDIEIAQSKIYSLISKELEFTLKSVPQISREVSRRSSVDYDSEINSPSLLSYNPSIFRSDSSQEELNSDLLDSPGMPELSITKSLPVFQRYNIAQLKKLLNNDISISPEDKLHIAIYDSGPRNLYTAPLNSTNSKGRRKANDKKKEEEDIQKACTELQNLDILIQNYKNRNAQTTEDILEIDQNKRQASKEGSELRMIVRELLQKVRKYLR